MKQYNFSGAQDWYGYFQVIFENTKINNMLEFGLGDGTEFLLDNCNYVKSIEISVSDYNKNWYEKCINKYKNYSNWCPVYIEASNEIKRANEIAQAERYPITYKDHILHLEEIIQLNAKDRPYDFIFVDAGIHNRGDIVNLSFNLSPIIAAHDSSRDKNRILENIYGYNIVNVPNNYLEFHFEDTYMGTTIWINKNYEVIINALNCRKG